MSVRRASIHYSVPLQTLRDSVVGKIPPETVTAGRVPVLSLDEEEQIVYPLKTVASLGYGYTRQEVVDLAIYISIFMQWHNDSLHPYIRKISCGKNSIEISQIRRPILSNKYSFPLPYPSSDLWQLF